MATLDRDIAIAVEAHAGQVDKGGAAYIVHPIRVMMRLTEETDRIVGVLHDVVEDCPGWTLARLHFEGFSDEVVDALGALTRRKGEGETYEAFIERCGRNTIARRVKLADLAGNMDPRRPAGAALLERYRRAVERLTVAPLLAAQVPS